MVPTAVARSAIEADPTGWATAKLLKATTEAMMVDEQRILVKVN